MKYAFINALWTYSQLLDLSSFVHFVPMSVILHIIRKENAIIKPIYHFSDELWRVSIKPLINLSFSIHSVPKESCIFYQKKKRKFQKSHD